MSRLLLSLVVFLCATSLVAGNCEGGTPNGILDAGEECDPKLSPDQTRLVPRADTHVGCDTQCMCKTDEGFVPKDPPALDCKCNDDVHLFLQQQSSTPECVCPPGFIRVDPGDLSLGCSIDANLAARYILHRPNQCPLEEGGTLREEFIQGLIEWLVAPDVYERRDIVIQLAEQTFGSAPGDVDFTLGGWTAPLGGVLPPSENFVLANTNFVAAVFSPPGTPGPIGEGKTFLQTWGVTLITQVVAGVPGTVLPAVGVVELPEQTCPASLEGDPHFKGFHGGEYDVMGEPDKAYALVSDVDFQVNGKFVSYPGEDATYVGELAVRAKSNLIFMDALSNDMGLSPVRPMNADGIYNLDNGVSVTYHQHTATIYSDPWILRVDRMQTLATASRHLDISLDSITGDLPARSPHGLLGQTARKTIRAHATGHQGEGVIEGHYTDYEVPDIWSTDFVYSVYQGETTD
eukprot:TRINITY_DN18606_c0_g1_i1.p1 TRINITY_DN18606_c0_g1~~TRINITY_DN18606_c0_g1_i1.p1  ORF type:complete len:461 (+),score=85.31 TRINITY_DN18606_c0_g1_i1:170-1552(+)